MGRLWAANSQVCREMGMTEDMPALCVIAVVLAISSSAQVRATSYHGTCQENQDHLVSVLGLGGDGRPDFAERKTCNFLTQYVECQTKGGLDRGSMATRMDAEMEFQLKIQLNDMEAQHWDIEKCPAVRTVLERLKKEDSETSTNTNSGAVTQAAVALPSLLATLYLATT